MVRTKKIQDKCEIETIKVPGVGILMKCKNLNREPTAQEVIDSVKTDKIIFK